MKMYILERKKYPFISPFKNIKALANSYSVRQLIPNLRTYKDKDFLL